MNNITSLTRAQIIAEALPFMQNYSGEYIVVKYGGHAMGDSILSTSFAQNIVMLKQAGMKPIVVHGGGPQIGEMLNSLGIESQFVNGLRVTDRKTIEVVEEVLAGTINKKIVSDINSSGGKSIGISGKDGPLILARKLNKKTYKTDSNVEKVIDLGYVGEPELINPEKLVRLCDSGFIPIIAPIGIDKNNVTYNINADTAAGAIAGSLGAKRLLMLTDIRGVLDQEGNLIKDLSKNTANDLINNGTIKGGMIPKIETCLDAISSGVEKAVILDGRVLNAIILELFTEDGSGTLLS
ncbi:MAG: acetylglutamate kinase [Alphaproteobacteria bacterium]|jgi:acetylglutamate kinase|tara:strand:- start:52209 stop:53093 length:885 start_codon:yes stop_codon:yes gene_type:complete